MTARSALASAEIAGSFRKRAAMRTMKSAPDLVGDVSTGRPKTQTPGPIFSGSGALFYAAYYSMRRQTLFLARLGMPSERDGPTGPTHLSLAQHAFRSRPD